jgi:hypothetical protein
MYGEWPALPQMQKGQPWSVLLLLGWFSFIASDLCNLFIEINSLDYIIIISRKV